MSLPLTKQQERVWRYIASCDRSPSYSEMVAATGIARSGINRIIAALKERGFVDYIPCRTRTVVALTPDDLSRFQTIALIGELERRGMVMAV